MADLVRYMVLRNTRSYLSHVSLQLFFMDTYFENTYAMANYWTDAYTKMWSSFVGNMVTVTKLANNMVVANMEEAFKASMQHANHSSNELSKAGIKVAE